MRSVAILSLATLALVSKAQSSGSTGYVNVVNIVNGMNLQVGGGNAGSYNCIDCQFQGGNYCSWFGNDSKSCYTGTAYCTQREDSPNMCTDPFNCNGQSNNQYCNKLI